MICTTRNRIHHFICNICRPEHKFDLCQMFSPSTLHVLILAFLVYTVLNHKADLLVLALVIFSYTKPKSSFVADYETWSFS